MTKTTKRKTVKKTYHVYNDPHSAILGYVVEDDAVLYVYFADGLVYVIDAKEISAEKFILCRDAAANGYGLEYLATTYCSSIYHNDKREKIAFFDFLRDCR